MFRKGMMLGMMVLLLAVVGCSDDDGVAAAGELLLVDNCAAVTGCCVQKTQTKTGERVVAISGIKSTPYYMQLSCEISSTCTFTTLTSVDNNPMYWVKVSAMYDAVRPLNQVFGTIHGDQFKSCTYKNGVEFRLSYRDKVGQVCVKGATGCAAQDDDGYIYIKPTVVADGGVADSGVKLDSKVTPDKAVVDSKVTPDQAAKLDTASALDKAVADSKTVDQAAPDQTQKADTGTKLDGTSAPDTGASTLPDVGPIFPQNGCYYRVYITGGKSYIEYCDYATAALNVNSFVFGCNKLTGICGLAIPKAGKATLDSTGKCITAQVSASEWIPYIKGASLGTGHNIAQPVVLISDGQGHYKATQWLTMTTCKPVAGSGTKTVQFGGSLWISLK